MQSFIQSQQQRFSAEMYEDYSSVPMFGQIEDSNISTCTYINSASCPDCGEGMVRQGNCFSCPVCGCGSCSG